MPIRRALKAVYSAVPFKRPLFTFIRRFVRVPGSIHQHLHFQGPFVVEIDDDHSFVMEHRGTIVENEIFWSGIDGGWEKTSIRIWMALCRGQSGLIADIGANSGVYALSAKALAPDAMVVAFEPVPRIATWLRANRDLNSPAIVVEEQAVSDTTGETLIHDIMTEHNYSASIEGQGPGAITYRIRTCRLDDYVRGLGVESIGPIKIDVERHEPSVVRGMLKTLRRHRPPVLIEILDDRIGAEVWAMIADLGYLCFQIREDAGLVPVDRPRSAGAENWNNLLCTAEQFETAGLAILLAH